MDKRKELGLRIANHIRCNGDNCVKRCNCKARACECPGCAGARQARRK